MENWIYILEDFDKDLFDLMEKNKEKGQYNFALVTMTFLYQACEKILKLEEKNGLLSKEKVYKDWEKDLHYLMWEFLPYTLVKRNKKEEELEFVTKYIDENWNGNSLTFFNEQLGKFYHYTDKYRIYAEAIW